MRAAPVIAAALGVFLDNVRIGTLYNHEPLAFSYDAAWLNEPAARAIDTAIPLMAGTQASEYIHAFFENLLPEGEQRKMLSLRYQVTSVFALLATVGGDTAGALVLLPDGQVPQPPLYRVLTWDRVRQALHASAAELAARDDAEEDEDELTRPRLSISGAQRKMLISLSSEGIPLEPMGTSPSSHIVKPDMLRPDLRIFASAINETLIMRTAAACHLPTAHISYQAAIQACLVERYDRVARNDGSLRRVWQADFCQLSGLPSTAKYEVDGGPTFAACFALVGRLSQQPAVDQRNLLRWLFFNLYVGNNDSHAKNLSMLATSGQGLRLAPFYDLMSTRVYKGLGPHFSFRVGGEFLPGRMDAGHLAVLAGEIGVAPRYLRKIASDVADQVERALPVAVRELHIGLGHAEQVIAERIELKVLSITKQMRQRFSL